MSDYEQLSTSHVVNFMQWIASACTNLTVFIIHSLFIITRINTTFVYFKLKLQLQLRQEKKKKRQYTEALAYISDSMRMSIRILQDKMEVQVQNNAANTILVQNFNPFDPAKEPYKNYIQRFQNYIEMRGISANKDYSLKLLLNSIGISTFNIITALAAPKTPAELDYDDLMQLLRSHFSLTRNILVAQHRFLTKYQNDKQTIAEFVAILRAEIGEYIADIFPRAQFIRGVKDNYMREPVITDGFTKI